jgi:hypothetical protein
MTTERHSWGPPARIPNALAIPHKTERQCLKCPIVKVTWHELDGSRVKYRTEFWLGLDQVEGDRTPACEVFMVKEESAA